MNQNEFEKQVDTLILEGMVKRAYMLSLVLSVGSALFGYTSFAFIGITLIQQLKLHGQSILVTNHYEDSAVRLQCETLGIGLIPKAMAAFVPLEWICFDRQ